MSITLRDYQQQAADEIRQHYRAGTKRVLLAQPCRSGKTVTFAYIAQGVAQKSKRVLIIAHRNFLIDQTSRTLTEFDVDHGIIRAGMPMDRRPVQVAMMMTVARRLDKIAPPDLIIVDEAHRAMCATYTKILQFFPNAYVLGVTATPARTDGKGLGDAFDVIVNGPQVRDLINNGYLCDYRLFAPPVVADLNNIGTVAGDYQKSELSERMIRPNVTGDAIAHYLQHANGKTFAAFCCGVAHAARVAESFTAVGVPTETINGDMKIPKRNAVLNRLRNREITGITAADLISEGFDLPALDAVIMLRPTQSLVIHVQQSCRALTPSPGKHTCIILDHAGNTPKHGFPDEVRRWTLDGIEKKTKKLTEVADVNITKCRQCGLDYNSNLKQCPYCAEERQRQDRFPEIIDGKLVEISLQDRMARARYSEALSYCKTPEDIKEMAKVFKKPAIWCMDVTINQLRVSPHEAARMLGYKPGFAWYYVNNMRKRA